MLYENKGFLPFWSPEAVEQLKRKGCGLINCGSGLGRENLVEAEIRQILRDALSGTNREKKQIRLLTGPTKQSCSFMTR